LSGEAVFIIIRQKNAAVATAEAPQKLPPPPRGRSPLPRYRQASTPRPTQHNRETLNSRELFDNVPFARISNEGELQTWLDSLESYSGDRLRFVGRVEVSEAKSDDERNELLLVREPVFSSEDVITFLLVLRWFPNAMKIYKPPRKVSTATDKDIKARPRRTESVELLQMVFLLAEKLYVPERYADEFIHLVGDRNRVTALQTNCLTLVLPASTAKEHNLSTNITSSQSQHTHQYQEYLYDNNASAHNRTDNDRSSLHSADSNPNTLALLKRKSARNSDRSPRFAERSLRHSEARSITL
jgi:hypothetical protein